MAHLLAFLNPDRCDAPMSWEQDADDSWPRCERRTHVGGVHVRRWLPGIHPRREWVDAGKRR